MKFSWEIDDGYVGQRAPQYTEIDDDDLAECETEEERQELINEIVQEDFEQKVSFCNVKEMKT